MPAAKKRTELGPKFSEGARLFWLALEKEGWNQLAAEHALGAKRGTVSRLLYGDRIPGVRLAATIEDRLGIPASSWVMVPRRKFKIPEAA